MKWHKADRASWVLLVYLLAAVIVTVQINVQFSDSMGGQRFMMANDLSSNEPGLSSFHSNEQTALQEELRESYLELVAIGLLGGLTHMAEVDKKAQATSDPHFMGRCLTRDWHDPDKRPDYCIVKWDGYERIMQVKYLYERIREQRIEGDLVECGVWRGGMTIMMRALLKAYGDKKRTVWVSDSFSGVPNTEQQKAHPDFSKIPQHIQQTDEKMWGNLVSQRIGGKSIQKNILTVEGEIVKDNFRRFGLLDDQVQFLPGWFNEALPHAAEVGLNKIALLRIDGDLYSSTMDVLVNLYKYVTPGGYIFFDDYNIGPSQKAIHDFFEQNGLNVTEIRNERVTGDKYRSRQDENVSKAMGAYFQKPLDIKP